MTITVQPMPSAAAVISSCDLSGCNAWLDAVALAELGAVTFRETFGHLYRPDDLQHFLATERSPAAFERHLKDADARITLALSGSTAVGYALTGPCKLPVPQLESGAGEVRQLYLRPAANRSTWAYGR